MGTNAKMHVQFHCRHWHKLGLDGESYADSGYQCTWEATRAQGGSAGILVNETGGTYGLSLNQGMPQKRAEIFLRQIEPVMPGLTQHYNGKVQLDYWPGERWARGSYSYWAVGQYTRFAGVEGRREGRCHFAGEHTSIDSQGYLNGAVETGQRAAQEIMVMMRGCSRA